METARVDIRKLQLLNDKINQCLDALNQVRLTVHGLSHSGAQTGGAQIGQPIGQQIGQPIGQSMGGFGAVDPRFAAQGFGATGLGAQSYGAGLSHSPFASSPFAQPFTPAYGGLQQGAGQPFSQWGQQGLGHSDVEAIYNRPFWADPMIASRVKETFPFVGYALPPIVSLY
jgi:hypothetical protein